jgi:hypothetical protein
MLVQEDSREKFTIVFEYTSKHSEVQKDHHVNTYNKRAHDRPKRFALHKKCLILMKDDTSRSMFFCWLGPAEIVEIKSPSSNVVKYHEKLYHLQSNKLHKFLVRTEEITYNNCIYVVFKEIPVLKLFV